MCRDRKWEEYNKSAETKEVYVATEFSAGCQHKEEIVSRQRIFCHNKKLKSNTGRILWQISLCCNIMKNRRQNLCRDKILFCRDIDYCNMEKLFEIEEEL